MIELQFGGNILKTRGTNGQLVFKSELLDDNKHVASLLQFLFINRNGSKVPFKLKRISVENHTIELNDCTSPEAAADFIGNEFFLEEKYLENISKSNASPESELIGYQILNGKEPLGEIVKINDYGMHVTADVLLESKKVIAIPLHEDLIENIEPDGKKIHMNLPDGLE